MGWLDRIKLQLTGHSIAPKASFSEAYSRFSFGYSLSDYRQIYETDDLVNQCINILAHFATQKGFETKIKTLSPDLDPEDYKDVKRKVDQINERVNLDHILYIAEVNRQIYGFSVFEVVGKYPEVQKIIPLRPEYTKIEVGDDWEIEKIEYRTTKSGVIEYTPEEVLIFVNQDLNGDYRGISKIKPILKSIEIRRELQEDIKQVSKRLWAPMVIASVDTSAVPEDQEASLLEQFKNQLKPGSSIITNKSIDVSTVSISPNITALVHSLSKVEEDIMGNFGVPKALLAREKTLSRATLEFSLKAMYEGPIKGIQTYLRREIESQFYKRIVKGIDENLLDEIRVLHKWKPVSMLEYAALAEPIANLVAKGVIDVPTAWNLLDLDTSYLRKVKGSPIQSSIAAWVEVEE